MESFFASLIKLTVIFLGSGFATLLAVWAATESKNITKLVLCLNSSNDQKPVSRLVVKKQEKISAESSTYEITIPGGQKVKLFSSHKGMKRI